MAAQNPKNDAPVQRWIRKTQANGFLIQIVVVESDAVLDEAEIRWIAIFKSRFKDCLNINPGGDRGALGLRRSDETKQKMRKPKSEETRQKMRKPKSEVARERMSLGQMGNTKARGEANRHAKLSIDDVRKIRELLTSGGSCTVIAKEFGVQKSCISKIAVGRSWSHV